MTENRREPDDVHDELIKIRVQFEEHKKHFEQHERDELKRHLEYKRVQNANAEKIDRLIESTAGLLEAWQTADGAIKFSVMVGKVLKWAGGFAVIYTFIDWLSRHGPE